MRLPETETEFKNALIMAAELGAMRALQGAGLLKPYLKKQEAYKLYGRGIVDRWIREGLVRLIKDGEGTASMRINRIEIEAVAMTANRCSYLTTDERKGKPE